MLEYQKMYIAISNAYAEAPAAAGSADLLTGLLPPLFIVIIIYYVFNRIKKKRNAFISAGKKANAEYEKKQGDSRIQIFISYRRDDSADVAGRIYDRLITQYGKEQVFKDVDSIPLGADFRDYIENAISNSSILLVVMGNSWLGQSKGLNSRRIDNPQDFPYLEVEAALKRNIPIIPVLVLGAKVPKGEELPNKISDLAYRNSISVRPDPDFNNDVNRLIIGIENIASK